MRGKESTRTYLDVHLGDHACLEGKWQVLLLKDLVDLLRPENEVFEDDVASEETDVKLLLIKAKKQLSKLVLELLVKPSFEHVDGPVFKSTQRHYLLI